MIIEVKYKKKGLEVIGEVLFDDLSPSVKDSIDVIGYCLIDKNGEADVPTYYFDTKTYKSPKIYENELKIYLRDKKLNKLIN